MLWVWLFEDSEIINFWNSSAECFTKKLKYTLRDSKAGAYLPALKCKQVFCKFFAVFLSSPNGSCKANWASNLSTARSVALCKRSHSILYHLKPNKLKTCYAVDFMYIQTEQTHK